MLAELLMVYLPRCKWQQCRQWPVFAVARGMERFDFTARSFQLHQQINSVAASFIKVLIVLPNWGIILVTVGDLQPRQRRAACPGGSGETNKYRLYSLFSSL